MSIDPKKYVDVDSQDTPIIIYEKSNGVIIPLELNPSTEQQVIETPEDVDGFAPVTVNAVTSSIDSNIQAGNIKPGVTILGVTGNYAPPRYRPDLEIDQNGKLNVKPTAFLGLGGATDVGKYALAYSYNSFYQISGTLDLSSLIQVTGILAFYYAFVGCSNLTGVNLSNLGTINAESSFNSAFINCSLLSSINLSSLTSIGGNMACNNMFNNCNNLTSIDLSSLETINNTQSCQGMFKNCKNLTTVNLSGLKNITGSSCCLDMFNYCLNLNNVNLSSLESITSASGCMDMFRSCTSLTSVTFPSLNNIPGSQCLYLMFQDCTSLQTVSFPALTSNSFGSNTNQFASMLSGCSNVTVHFPSNLQGVIGDWYSVASGFGGTNTTVLFDLTATE